MKLPEYKLAQQEIEAEGFQAYEGGNCEEQCPYPQGTFNHELWCKGLREARECYRKAHASLSRLPRATQDRMKYGTERIQIGPMDI